MVPRMVCVICWATTIAAENKRIEIVRRAVFMGRLFGTELLSTAKDNISPDWMHVSV
jgi:hypothetical protein